MKKILIMAVAFVVMISMAMPVMAATTNVGSEVTITSAGNAPIIKCKWEQEPITELESGDPTHVLFKTGAPSNAQFNPPMVKGAKKPIVYYAVVTDKEEGGNVAQVFADVYHPLNSPPPYSTSKDPRGPFFKYEIPFSPMVQFLPGGIISDTDKGNEIAALNAAYNAKLVSFANGYTLAEVVTELSKGTAVLWKGTALIDYEQPAGEYTVNVFGIDKTNATSAPLVNTFTYVAISGVEVDFNKIIYGSVGLDIEKMIAGDVIWDANPNPVTVGEGQANQATVRNIGNTWAHVTIKQSDLGFGKDINGMWNVAFDARMGNSDTYRVYYDPEQTVVLPNFLKLSTQDELDLSIKVHKSVPGQTLYGGTITIGSTIEPFAVQNGGS
jgi:hypothetical protein